MHRWITKELQDTGLELHKAQFWLQENGICGQMESTPAQEAGDQGFNSPPPWALSTKTLVDGQATIFSILIIIWT